RMNLDHSEAPVLAEPAVAFFEDHGRDSCQDGFMAHSWQLAIRIRYLGTLPSVTHRVAGQRYGNWRDLKEVIEYEIARAYGQHDDTEVGGWFREAEICTRAG